jgi:hypothetical protein
MANTKISQLPSYTGSAADLRWFVMNNSGETTTYKYSGYTSPFRKADGFNSTISVYYNPNVVPNKLDMILGGTGNTMAATSTYTDGLGNSIVGGANNVMDLNSPAGGQHYGHSIFGGNNNTLRWRANASVNTIVGGQGNLMDCYYGGNTIIGGSSNTSQGSANNTIIGAQSSTITGGDRNGIWGGYSQSVGGPSDNNIYGGFDNTITDGSYNSIVGGNTNTITDGDYNFIGGGQNNSINSNTRNNYAIVGGADNIADGESGFGLTTGQYNNTQGRWGFVAGRNNTINANNAQFCLGWANTMTGDNSDTLGIFGSYNNTLDVSSTQAATIIGSSNSQLRTRGSFSQHNGSTIFGSNASFIKESPSTNNKYSGSRTGIILSNESGIYNSNSSNYLDHNLILSSSASTIYDSSQSQIIGGINNTISGKTNVVMVGTSGRTATRNDATFVENLVVFNYAGLNFADDTAAAAGGVVLGQVYHTGGVLKIRIV